MLSSKDFHFPMQIGSWGFIKEMAIRGLCIGYVPEYVIAQEEKTNQLYKAFPPGQPYEYKIHAIWNKNKKLSRNAQLFLGFL